MSKKKKTNKIPIKRLPPEIGKSELNMGFTGYESGMVEVEPLELDPTGEDGKNATWAKECPTSCSHYRMRRKQIKNAFGTVISTYITGEVNCLIKSKPSQCGNSYMAETPHVR